MRQAYIPACLISFLGESLYRRRHLMQTSKDLSRTVRLLFSVFALLVSLPAFAQQQPPKSSTAAGSTGAAMTPEQAMTIARARALRRSDSWPEARSDGPNFARCKEERGHSRDSLLSHRRQSRFRGRIYSPFEQAVSQRSRRHVHRRSCVLGSVFTDGAGSGARTARIHLAAHKLNAEGLRCRATGAKRNTNTK